MSHPSDIKACARCGRRRVTRPNRGLYCKDCITAVQPGSIGWMQWAACLGVAYDPEWWWPTSSHDPHTPVALSICDHCKVRDLCSDYAIQHDIVDGIWGGLMPEDRRRIRAAQRKAVS